MTALLSVENLQAAYGPVKALHRVDLELGAGEVVMLLGANGAGKTTTLRSISGSVAVGGRVLLDGTSLVGCSPATIARRGIAHVPQGRGTFPELTVQENLEVGAIRRRDRAAIVKDIDGWCDRFPVLAQRRRQQAGLLSGGEQQMLAIARAMLSQPRVLMLDEPSLGLAPKIVHEIFGFFREINQQLGAAMLIVEQNAELALQVATRGYVLEVGRTVISGTADELRSNGAVQAAYLGRGR